MEKTTRTDSIALGFSKNLQFLWFLLASGDFVFCWLNLQTVWTQIRTDRLLILIWIQFVWHSGKCSWKKIWKKLFWKKSADDNKSMKNNQYPACHKLILLTTMHLYGDQFTG